MHTDSDDNDEVEVLVDVSDMWHCQSFTVLYVLNEDAVVNDIHNLFEKGLDYHDNDNMCMVYMKL